MFNIRIFLLAMIIALVLCWDVYLLIAWNSYLDARKSFDRQSSQFMRITDNIKKTNSSQTADDILKYLEETKANIFKNIRVRYSNAEILSFIARAASSMGLTDVRPTIGKTTSIGTFNSNSWEKTRVDIRFRARYHEAARMINIIEKSPYLFEIKIYSIKRGGKDPSGPTYTRVVADIYRLL